MVGILATYSALFLLLLCPLKYGLSVLKAFFTLTEITVHELLSLHPKHYSDCKSDCDCLALNFVLCFVLCALNFPISAKDFYIRVAASLVLLVAEHTWCSTVAKSRVE